MSEYRRALLAAVVMGALLLGALTLVGTAVVDGSAWFLLVLPGCVCGYYFAVRSHQRARKGDAMRNRSGAAALGGGISVMAAALLGRTDDPFTIWAVLSAPFLAWIWAANVLSLRHEIAASRL